MLVSIIMICYNVEAFIDRAIESIIHQTYTDWELIISDDASTDATVQCIQKYLHDERIRLIAHKQNMGFVKNKNNAFLHAKGALLTLMDSDDTCTPDRIARQVEVFQQHPEIMWCATHYRRIDERDNELYAVLLEEDRLLKEIPDDFLMSYNTIMVRSQVIDEFGLFSEYFSECHGEDQYWAFKIICKYPLYYLKEILYNYRLNSASLTSNFKHPRQLILAEILDFLKKQRKETGTDCLERGNPGEIQRYEEGLLNDKPFMAEKYRALAVREIEVNRLHLAARFLRTSFALNKWNKQWYRTLRYYFTKRFLTKID